MDLLPVTPRKLDSAIDLLSALLVVKCIVIACVVAGLVVQAVWP